MTKREQKRLLQFAGETAVGAGAILRRGFSKRKRITYKGRIDPVTEYDLKSEKFIVRKISGLAPDHEILTEEGSATGVNSAFRWVIDPLDGTMNFAHGFPVYSVSIGLQHEGESILGAVYDPERDELFTAAKGAGAFCNGKPIQVSKERNLHRALLTTGFSYEITTLKPNNLGFFARMAKKAQGIRRPGSAAIDLCWLACGRIDGFWELDLHPWDTAAGIIIITEAGGEVSRIKGQPYSIHNSDLLASNRLLHRSMMSVLTKKPVRDRSG
jgi:myo-inositol-1(or 4)-monophosphatase